MSVLPKARADLDIRPAGGESVVHDPVSGTVHILNATAARVLARCDGTTSVAALADELAAGSAIPVDRIAGDIERVCADFRAKGLLASN